MTGMASTLSKTVAILCCSSIQVLRQCLKICHDHLLPYSDRLMNHNHPIILLCNLWCVFRWMEQQTAHIQQGAESRWLMKTFVWPKCTYQCTVRNSKGSISRDALQELPGCPTRRLDSIPWGLFQLPHYYCCTSGLYASGRSEMNRKL